MTRSAGWRPPLRTVAARASIPAICVAAVIGLGLWYNEHRTATWRQTFNPVYWYRRATGQDLYDPARSMLLHGSRSVPEIALTFDDGPHAGSLESILGTLRARHIRATFFDVGANMQAHPELLRATLQDGHEVGNHSFSHERLINLTERSLHREINDTDIVYYGITGRHLVLLRPPGMRYNTAVCAEARRLGYRLVNYTTASMDFNPSEPPALITSRTLHRTENGSIVLLHDYPSTAAALPDIVDTLAREGYRFVTISEMLDRIPQAGTTARPPGAP